MSVNMAIIVGHLGKDPEVRYTQSGQAVANFSVATSEEWTGRDGNPKERTEWHKIVVWGKQAETCGRYLSKGRQVFIEGNIQSRSYEDKTGNTRYITEIVARRVQFLGGGGARASQESQDQGYQGQSQDQGFQGQGQSQGFGQTQDQGYGNTSSSSFPDPSVDDDIPF